VKVRWSEGRFTMDKAVIDPIKSRIGECLAEIV
jgi:hypothetical protein